MLARFVLFLLTTGVAFSALPPILRNAATTNAVPPYQGASANLTALAGNDGSALTNSIPGGATNPYQFVTLLQLEEASAGATVAYFNTLSPANGFTPTGTVLATNYAAIAVPAQNTNAAATASNGQYIAKFISTNTYTSFASGLAVIEVFVFENSAGSAEITAEAYVVNGESKIEEYEFTPAPVYQTVPAGTTPTKLTFSVPVTDYNSTTNLHFAIKLKVQESGVDPTVRIVTGGAYPSHVSFTVPTGLFVNKGGDTMTGDLTVGGALSAESLAVTGSGVGLMLLGDGDGDHYGGVAPTSTTTTDTILKLPAAPVAGYVTATIDAATNWVLTATSMITLSQSDDPDVSAAGQLTWDTDGWLRAYDGSAQIAVGRKLEEVHATVIAPNDLADAVRDACLIWSNESGMNFIVTGWKAWSGTDDTTLNIETTAADGTSNATVDAVEIATNGTGVFTGADTTITAGTIANGSLIWLDFDDTDAPTYVKITLYGYYAADVN